MLNLRKPVSIKMKNNVMIILQRSMSGFDAKIMNFEAMSSSDDSHDVSTGLRKSVIS